MKHLNKIVTSFFLVFIVSFSSVCSACSPNVSHNEPEYYGFKHKDGYQLEQVTMVSRHGIRSPIKTPTEATNYEWFKWTSGPGELSLLGGQEEVYLGQYFKKYLERENLIPQNWIPKNDEALFYTNSIQRTIATGQYFASGMIPVANQKIEHKYELGKMDKFFNANPVNNSDSFKKQVDKEEKEFNNGKTDEEILKPSVEELEKVLDFKNSPYAKEHNIEHIYDKPLENGEESFVGYAVSLADSLTFQYLEEPDDVKAGFGKELTYDQMRLIDKILGFSIIKGCGLYTYACSGMQPLLNELLNDLNNKNRKFSFYGGHDSTLSPLCAALKVKPFSLPDTVDEVTPIGGKVVLSKFKDSNGQEFCTLNFVYESTDQIRKRSALSLDSAPVCYPLELDGLSQNSDGMYKLSDVENRIKESLNVPNLYN